MSSADSSLKLKPIQLAALVILMAEAREVTNKELEEMAGFSLVGKDRAPLEKHGYVECRKVGRVLAFQLTDRGWAFSKQLHAAGDMKVERSRVGRSIFVLLKGLSRSLDRLRVSHAEFFKQSPDVELAEPAADAVNIEEQIRSAYSDIPKAPDGWVGLADLRERLVGLDRTALDDTLRAMARTDGVRIIPVANTKSLQERDRAAALRIGEEDNHALWIGAA